MSVDSCCDVIATFYEAFDASSLGGYTSLLDLAKAYNLRLDVRWMSKHGVSGSILLYSGISKVCLTWFTSHCFFPGTWWVSLLRLAISSIVCRFCKFYLLASHPFFVVFVFDKYSGVREKCCNEYAGRFADWHASSEVYSLLRLFGEN